MADLSEVKRSNFAILLNNYRMLWPIDVRFSGMMDILRKMPPRPLGLYVQLLLKYDILVAKQQIFTMLFSVSCENLRQQTLRTCRTIHRLAQFNKKNINRLSPLREMTSIPPIVGERRGYNLGSRILPNASQIKSLSRLI